MVRIIGYNTRQKEDGSLFNVLQVQGGIEMIKSKETGQFYATAKELLLLVLLMKKLVRVSLAQRCLVEL